MKKQDRGAVLTSVILMVLVMTLIGVPLIGMVVFNYRLRSMDNTLKSSEYENEMALDRIYLVIRETVIHAIDYAKANATDAVNATSELQRTQYASVRAKYEDLWIRTLDNYNGVINDEMLSNLGTIPDTLKQQLKAEADVDNAKEKYVNYQIQVELSAVHDEELDSDESHPLYVGSLVQSEDGLLDDAALKLAYNKVFQYYYQGYIKETVYNLTDGTEEENSNVIHQIYQDENYSAISAEEIIFGEGEATKESYLKIQAAIADDNWTDAVLNVDAAVDFCRDVYALPTSISATFVIDTPEFDSVTNIEQQTVALSNPITTQGVTVGGTLTVMDDTSLSFANDITVMSYNEATNTDVDDGIVLEAGAKLEGIDDARISVNGDIVMKNRSKLISGTSPLYYRNLYVGQIGDGTGTTYGVTFNGNVVAKDDLEINTDGTVSITQGNAYNYYGFNDINDEGPDSSSAIVVNSEQLTNKTLSFGNLYLAGRAFIDGAKSVRPRYVEDVNGEYKENEDGEYVKVTDGTGTHRNEERVYKTGESVAVRGNYVAYQTPLFNNATYASDKINYSTYFIKNKTDAYGKSEVPIYLADTFVKADNVYSEEEYNTFDTEHKWKYFLQYASEYSGLLRRLKVISADVKHMEGVGFDESGNVMGREDNGNTAFRDNLATEYEKYTKYFGYRPINDDGEVDTTKVKTRIFGTNGWISSTSSLASKETGNYKLIYDMNPSNKTTLVLNGNDNKGIIICRGDLEVTVTGDATFSGMIVVGGNFVVKGGGTLTLADAKEETVNTIIGNYLGTNSDVTGEGDGLYQIFEYDNSGTTYVVTEVNDTFINVNDLINITNWKKQDVGRL